MDEIKEVFQLNDMVEECRCHMAVECAMCVRRLSRELGVLYSFEFGTRPLLLLPPCHFDGMLPLRDFFWQASQAVLFEVLPTGGGRPCESSMPAWLHASSECVDVPCLVLLR